jgi:hypothetical protein
VPTSTRTPELRPAVLDPVSEPEPRGGAEPEHRSGPVLGVADEHPAAVVSDFDATATVRPAIRALTPAQAG